MISEETSPPELLVTTDVPIFSTTTVIKDRFITYSSNNSPARLASALDTMSLLELSRR